MKHCLMLLAIAFSTNVLGEGYKTLYTGVLRYSPKLDKLVYIPYPECAIYRRGVISKKERMNSGIVTYQGRKVNKEESLALWSRAWKYMYLLGSWEHDDGLDNIMRIYPSQWISQSDLTKARVGTIGWVKIKPLLRLGKLNVPLLENEAWSESRHLCEIYFKIDGKSRKYDRMVELLDGVNPDDVKRIRLGVLTVMPVIIAATQTGSDGKKEPVLQRLRRMSLAKFRKLITCNDDLLILTYPHIMKK